VLKTLILAAAVTASALAAQADPLAGYREPTAAIAVSTRGVDLAKPAEVKAFHELLRLKAAHACDSRQPRSLAVIASDRACAREALDRAVAETAAPLLTAYHQGSPIGSTPGRFARR